MNFSAHPQQQHYQQQHQLQHYQQQQPQPFYGYQQPHQRPFIQPPAQQHYPQQQHYPPTSHPQGMYGPPLHGNGGPYPYHQQPMDVEFHQSLPPQQQAMPPQQQPEKPPPVAEKKQQEDKIPLEFASDKYEVVAVGLFASEIVRMRGMSHLAYNKQTKRVSPIFVNYVVAGCSDYFMLDADFTRLLEDCQAYEQILRVDQVCIHSSNAFASNDIQMALDSLSAFTKAASQWVRDMPAAEPKSRDDVMREEGFVKKKFAVEEGMYNYLSGVRGILFGHKKSERYKRSIICDIAWFHLVMYDCSWINFLKRCLAKKVDISARLDPQLVLQIEEERIPRTAIHRNGFVDITSVSHAHRPCPVDIESSKRRASTPSSTLDGNGFQEPDPTKPAVFNVVQASATSTLDPVGEYYKELGVRSLTVVPDQLYVTAVEFLQKDVFHYASNAKNTRVFLVHYPIVSLYVDMVLTKHANLRHTLPAQIIKNRNVPWDIAENEMVYCVPGDSFAETNGIDLTDVDDSTLFLKTPPSSILASNDAISAHPNQIVQPPEFAAPMPGPGPDMSMGLNDLSMGFNGKRKCFEHASLVDYLISAENHDMISKTAFVFTANDRTNMAGVYISVYLFGDRVSVNSLPGANMEASEGIVPTLAIDGINITRPDGSVVPHEWPKRKPKDDVLKNMFPYCSWVLTWNSIRDADENRHRSTESDKFKIENLIKATKKTAKLCRNGQKRRALNIRVGRLSEIKLSRTVGQHYEQIKNRVRNRFLDHSRGHITEKNLQVTQREIDEGNPLTYAIIDAFLNDGYSLTICNKPFY